MAFVDNSTKWVEYRLTSCEGDKIVSFASLRETMEHLNALPVEQHPAWQINAIFIDMDE